MKRCHRKYVLFAAVLLAGAGAQGDIVWSGEQNVSGEYYYHYVVFNSDSIFDAAMEYGKSGNNSFPPTYVAGYLGASVGDGLINGLSRVLRNPSIESNAALPAGMLISGTPDAPYEWLGGTFASGRVSSWSIADTEWRGPLGEDGEVYVGIEFSIEGEAHYGWVHVALGDEVGRRGIPRADDQELGV